MDTLCGLFGKTRQAYYKKKKTQITKSQLRAVLLEAISYYRSQAPGMGGVKLHTELSTLYGYQVTGGRDAFLRFMRAEKMMLPARKPRYTTQSNHLFRKYPNLIKGLQVTYPNHIWVSDITYIWIEGSVCYLHLLTDSYSHAVLGWVLAPGLHAEYTAQALEQAIAKAGGGNLCGTIHHSDRGTQYACYLYISLLTDHHIQISMTEDSKPTDNAIAERMNGILKTEWIYGISLFKNEEQARQRIGQMIQFYNYDRPHMSIGMKKPMDVYEGEVPGENLWKKKGKTKL
ncbi:IS3 family transposase [Bacteroides reticulotermitis]|uniref:Mobile element protein n=3 Tax=Bacteroides reticulotermitis TaxID=1133319 RepID=W4UZI5_9BACE|nr:IS3 family transposase [Bacteroides reticulotermitis]MBB4046494.1 transposase InsO family protein [Bacteroides reticulotermitis]GAE86675.1 mobile element protein [Bacteroides reticulotermitis JCM 10512]